MSFGIFAEISFSAAITGSSCCFAVVGEVGVAGREQHFGLEHKAVADDADIGAIADDLAQPAEKLGAVAGQLLHLGGERQIEPASEIGDLGLLVLGLGLGDVERRGNLRELLAQRGDRGGQLLDLRSAPPRLSAARRQAPSRPFPRRSAECALPIRSVCSRLELQRSRLAALARKSELAVRSSAKQIAQLADLLLQLLQRLVTPRQRVREEELAGGEHQQNEDDHHQKLRQRVDEAWPDVDAGAP